MTLIESVAIGVAFLSAGLVALAARSRISHHGRELGASLVLGVAGTVAVLCSDPILSLFGDDDSPMLGLGLLAAVLVQLALGGVLPRRGRIAGRVVASWAGILAALVALFVLIILSGGNT